MARGDPVLEDISHNKVRGLVLTDLAANRPPAGIAGRWFISTDTLEISYDDGAAWHRVGVLRGKDVGALDAGDIATGRFPLARMPEGPSGQVLTGRGAGVDPTYDDPGARITVAETQVFSGAVPVAWTDLDLSPVVGANVAIVFLKIHNPQVNIIRHYGFRTNGEVELEAMRGDVSVTGTRSTGPAFGLVVVPTDSFGIVEWRGREGGHNITIDIVAYIS